jgi:proteasome-associated ATPase
VLARGREIAGEIVTLKEVFDDRKRALIVGRADEERVVELADGLADGPLRSGDSLLMDPRSGLLLERIPKAEVEELVLEEVPDIS